MMNCSNVREETEGASSLEGAKKAWGPEEKRYCVLLAWLSDVIANVPVERCAIAKEIKRVIDKDIFCDAELGWLAFMKLPCAINKMLQRFAMHNKGRHNYLDWKLCSGEVVERYEADQRVAGFGYDSARKECRELHLQADEQDNEDKIQAGVPRFQTRLEEP